MTLYKGTAPAPSNVGCCSELENGCVYLSAQRAPYSGHLARAIRKENGGSRGLGNLKTDFKLSKALGFTGISENRLCFCSLVQASLNQAFKISFSSGVLERDRGTQWAPFAANHSHSRKPPCWRAKVTLGKDNQRLLLFTTMYMSFVCLVPVRLFSALQYGGIAPHEWIAANGLLPNFPSA